MKQLTFALSLFFLSGCNSMYFGALEKIGYHKRDLMVSRVEAAKESQKDAKEQFRSALQQFQAVLGAKSSNLQDTYDKLSKELERSESKAKAVSSRIDAVEDVSVALFAEWEYELVNYKNQSLKDRSEQKLESTKAKYNDLMHSMRRAEGKPEPVLQPLRDEVLFLKHNLNAQAVGSLGDELQSVEVKVDGLIRDLELSIAEADRFVGELNKSG